MTPETKVPVDAEVVQPWVDLILRLADDDEFYQQASRRALQAGGIYRRKALAPRSLEFFERVLGGEVTAG